MSALQKQHAFNLVVILVAFALFALALPMIGFQRAGGVFGVLGFLGFGVLFVWNRKGVVLTDERDSQIQIKAYSLAFAIFWLLFVAGCVGTWLMLGDNGQIPVRILPVIMYLAWGIWQGAMSAAVLIKSRALDGEMGGKLGQ